MEIYPVYLVNTLFLYDDEYIVKERGKELAERYFIWAELKDSANELYHKGLYYDSLLYYEKVLKFSFDFLRKNQI